MKKTLLISFLLLFVAFNAYADKRINGSLSIAEDLTVAGTYYGIKDEMVIMDYPSGSSEYTLNDYLNDTQSAGWVSGGEFNDDGDGTMTVSAGVGVIKSTASDTGENFLFDWRETELSPDDETSSYVYVDYNSGTPIVQISSSNVANGTTKFNLGLVFREDTELHFFRAGQVVNNFQKRVIQTFNSMGNIRLTSGGSVAETGERYMTVTESVLFGGVVRFTTSAINTSTGDTFGYYYTDGLGGFQYLTESGVQINNTQYDNGGTLTVLNNNRYRTDFLYLSNDGDLLAMLGTNNDRLLVTAQNVTPPTSLPPHIADFATIIAKVIVREGSANLIEVSNLRTTSFTTSGAVVHNETTDKQGGTTGEYYHATADEYTVLQNTSGVNTGDQDLSSYLTIDGAAAIYARQDNVLELDNTDAFTPDADYEPATKKYVDDNAGGGSTVYWELVGNSIRINAAGAVGSALWEKIGNSIRIKSS